VDRYSEAKFDFKTLGLSGNVQIKKLKEERKKRDKTDGPKIIDIGTLLTSCQQPYQKTQIIKFVPRFILINKLDRHVVLREAGKQEKGKSEDNYQIYLRQNVKHELKFRD
jgi:hypothetical protein